MTDGPAALAAAPRLRRRAVAGYCLFDFANSAYTTVISTVAYSVYFRQVVVAAADNRGDELWGYATSLAMLIVALTSPVLGALADYSGRKKFFLVLATLQAVLATALMATVGPGQIAWGFLLYVVATIGFEGGYVFYNAFLPDVSTPSTIGKISGWAWGTGYVGGLAALLLCYPLIVQLHDPAGRLIPEAVASRQASFLVVAAFFLVFALPAFFWLQESPRRGDLRSWRDVVTIGFRRVAETLRGLRAYREVRRYVIASLFFTDGITTIIGFSAIYAEVTFGFSSSEVVLLFLLLNIVAIPGAVGGGYLADRIGAKVLSMEKTANKPLRTS